MTKITKEVVKDYLESNWKDFEEFVVNRGYTYSEAHSMFDQFKSDDENN